MRQTRTSRKAGSPASPTGGDSPQLVAQGAIFDYCRLGSQEETLLYMVIRTHAATSVNSLLGWRYIVRRIVGADALGRVWPKPTARGAGGEG